MSIVLKDPLNVEFITESAFKALSNALMTHPVLKSPKMRSLESSARTRPVRARKARLSQSSQEFFESQTESKNDVEKVIPISWQLIVCSWKRPQFLWC